MAEIIVNEHSTGQQIIYQEKIERCLHKLGALCNVAILTDNFFELSEFTIRNYFMTASDLLEEALEMIQTYFEEGQELENILMREI